jgi:hypothetical protein
MHLVAFQKRLSPTGAFFIHQPVFGLSLLVAHFQKRVYPFSKEAAWITPPLLRCKMHML